MNLLECFDDKSNTCPITMDCRLKHILFKAKHSFLEVLKGHTLADLLPENDISPVIQHIPINNIQVISSH